MNYQIQNEQSGMEWAVNQEDYHPFDTPADPEGQALYEALIEELGIELPPSNPEQGMVANATDGVNNDQASFYSQALPKANYDDLSRRLSREEMDSFTTNTLGPNNLLGFERDMRVDNEQAPVHSQPCSQLPRFNSPYYPYGNYQSNVTNTLPSQPSQSQYVNSAELHNNGNNEGNGNDEGNGDDKGISNNNFGVGAPPQPLIVPEALKPNTAGNRVKKAGGKKTGNKNGRKIGQRACDSCRKSHLTCKTETGANSCNQCLEKKTPCNQGSTADKRTKKSNEQGLLNTVDACKKYLKDLLILIFGMHDAKPEIKQGNMPFIRKLLSKDHPDPSFIVEFFTTKPLDEVTAQARVRLDALANLQLDLEGIHRVTEMRKHTKLCIERTREHVITLGRYLHVLMDGTYDAESVDFSLATVVGSPAPFSQIGQEIKTGFSHSDSGIYVDSLVGCFDRMVATISGK